MDTIAGTALLDWSRPSIIVATTTRAEIPRAEVHRPLWERFRGWQARRQTVRLLCSVDGATLRDLGISRLEIEGLVYGDNDDRTRRYDSNLVAEVTNRASSSAFWVAT